MTGGPGLLDERAPNHVSTYNARCLHYNLVADGVYNARRRIGDALSPEFEPYIVAGLLGFDMGRTMGGGDVYSVDSGFAGRLRRSLRAATEDLNRPSDVGSLLVADFT